MMISEQAISTWQQELAEKSPQAIVKFALTQFPNLALSFSGAEDVVLIDMAVKTKLPFRVFTLDTGRLHPETYRYLETVRSHYQLNLEVCYPNAAALAEFVTINGLFSFYDTDHKACCNIRKVGPLREKLATADAWMTGQRRDQSPGTRQDVAVVQMDHGFAPAGQTLVKFNPLAKWTSEEVWNYIRALEIPYNPLHEKGFISIGCEPCTRPVLPNQHEREGRWWWEAETHKECGLHASNLIAKG